MNNAQPMYELHWTLSEPVMIGDTICEQATLTLLDNDGEQVDSLTIDDSDREIDWCDRAAFEEAEDDLLRANGLTRADATRIPQ